MIFIFINLTNFFLISSRSEPFSPLPFHMVSIRCPHWPKVPDTSVLTAVWQNYASPGIALRSTRLCAPFAGPVQPVHPSGSTVSPLGSPARLRRILQRIKKKFKIAECWQIDRVRVKRRRGRCEISQHLFGVIRVLKIYRCWVIFKRFAFFLQLISTLLIDHHYFCLFVETYFLSFRKAQRF